MLTLLNDILDFSSLEVGKLVLHQSSFDLFKIQNCYEKYGM